VRTVAVCGVATSVDRPAGLVTITAEPVGPYADLRRGHVDKPGTAPLDTLHHGVVVVLQSFIWTAAVDLGRR